MKKAITEIRGLDSTELRSKLQDLRKEQFGLRFRGSPEEVKKTTRHSEVRRTIARILMVLGDRDRIAVASLATGSEAAGSRVAAANVAGGKK
ncbi:MAG: 50S ribosomal protein L29 [Planctomycetota bacterium]|nr:50S ribosomal protein L29 [Planctomycetota bacterium]